MITAFAPSLTLEQFLQQPETKPASQFINGKIEQKPMPQGEHSTIQSELVSTINAITKPQKIAYAFPELRCTFAQRSIVPDVAIFEWDRIPRTNKGRIANRFNTYPDWCIEILSPDQSLTKVLDNLLFCGENGTDLGWLINPEEEVIFIVFPDKNIKLLRGDEILTVLNKIDLKLTVNDIFNWLNI
jgi:Uma2 family endonuclease